LLLSDSRYVSEDNNVLKAKVYTDVMSMDEELISLLLGNEKVRDEFFVEVKDTLVFEYDDYGFKGGFMYG
jgi:adenine-specific DNA-methyltransferase